MMFLSNCTVCWNKKMRFIKEQEAGRILNRLGIRKALNKILSLGPILF